MRHFYDDNDETSGIFNTTRGRVNDNGNINKPNDKGPYGTYQSLSEDEKNFIFNYPRMAYKFYNNSKKAKSVGRLFNGTSNGYGDAVRHCYWCALNQVSAGLNSPLAEEYGNAHENTPSNKINEKIMDLHNNSVGYYLGNQAIKNNWSEDELLRKIIKAADDGILQTGT